MEGKKFYYPDGRKFKNQNEFIKFYSDSYYLHRDRVIWGVPQNSEHVEREIEGILENGITKEEHIEKMIAWKIGAIKHVESDRQKKFEYYNRKPNRNRYNREIPLEPLYEYILKDVSTLEKQAKERPQDVLKELITLKGIGPVYAITILYFLSRKKYPIYDQYAHFALKAITENIGFSNKLFTNAELNKEVVLSYDPEVLFSTYKKNYMDCLKENFPYYKDRDIDRALWVYGHLFKDTKTNQKRIKTNSES